MFIVIAVWLLLVSFVISKESGNLSRGKTVSASVVPDDYQLQTYTMVGPTDLYTCSLFSASNTSYATQNYELCYFSACGGTTVIISGCGACTGDEYVRLYSSGTQADFGDDGCGSAACSYISYTIPGNSSDCYNYDLYEGCYNADSCSGVLTVSGSDWVATQTPTEIPTLSIAPTISFAPSEVPSETPTEVPSFSFAPTLPTVTCAYYYTSETHSTTQNYAVCSFSACGGTPVDVSGCGCTGDQLLILYDNSGEVVDESDDYCGLCSYITFTPPGSSSDCQVYELHEGCYGLSTCNGTVTVSGDVMSASATPSEVYTGAPSISNAPTSLFHCPPYTAINTYSNSYNTSECSFTACGGSIVTVSGCGMCSGDQYLSLADDHDYWVISNDNACGSCSGFTYTVPGDSDSCRVYTIIEGCYYTETCSGTVSVDGSAGYLAPPTLAPSFAPVVSLDRPLPMVYSVVIPVVVATAAMFTMLYAYFYRTKVPDPSSGDVKHTPLSFSPFKRSPRSASPSRVHITDEEGMEMT